MAVCAMMSTVGSPLAGCFYQVINKKMGLLFSIVLCSVALFLIGPSPTLHLPENIGIIIMGLALLGLGKSGITVTIVPELLESIQEEVYKIPRDEKTIESRTP